MTINWNPLVNAKFSLEDNFSLQDGFIEELVFTSGKKRTWLRNSYVPKIFPSLSLLLDNKTQLENGKTEFEEFENWFNNSLRYGSISFQTTRIGFKDKWNTKQPAKGIYKFISVPEYDRLDGLVAASFGLEETASTSEVEHTYLTTNKGGILLTNNKNAIAIN